MTLLAMVLFLRLRERPPLVALVEGFQVAR